MSKPPTSLDRQMEAGRSFVYRLLILGLPVSAATLVGLWLDWTGLVMSVLHGGTAGLLIATATGDYDEFAKAELSFAARASVVALGVLGFPGIFSLTDPTPLFSSAWLWGLLSFTFFSALTFKRLRGTQE